MIRFAPGSTWIPMYSMVTEHAPPEGRGTLQPARLRDVLEIKAEIGEHVVETVMIRPEQ